MKHDQQYVLLAAALAVAFAMPATRAAAFAGNDVAATTNPGFVPDTGQINRGFDEVVPSSAPTRPVPTPAQARAAFMMPATGGPESNGNETTGASSAIYTLASSAAPSIGPIGATGQTMPAEFSARNDILDRVPIAAWPLRLSDEERQRIYQAVMADKTPAASDAAVLAPASELDVNQALNDAHPLPASVSGIAGARALAYVKTKDKVFLVKPAARTVVDEIGS